MVGRLVGWLPAWLGLVDGCWCGAVFCARYIVLVSFCWFARLLAAWLPPQLDSFANLLDCLADLMGRIHIYTYISTYVCVCVVDHDVGDIVVYVVVAFIVVAAFDGIPFGCCCRRQYTAQHQNATTKTAHTADYISFIFRCCLFPFGFNASQQHWMWKYSVNLSCIP